MAGEFIADLRDNGTAAPELKVRATEAEAIAAVHDFFLSYGFEIRDERPYDPGNARHEGDEQGFRVFDNVLLVDGKLARFMHCAGDGPVATIRRGT